MSSSQPVVLSVAELLGSGRYFIPIYQRAYAWGRDEIDTLLTDVWDYWRRDPGSSYYIGSLVVNATRPAGSEHTLFEVVDGQQRLTTLYLIVSYLHRLSLTDVPAGVNLPAIRRRLEFEGRAQSTDYLSELARVVHPSDVPADRRDARLQFGLETVEAWFASREGDAGAYIDYLLTKVKIVRSTLPGGTDLNHYFEIMNSRGEQLEKHEVVKAKLLSTPGLSSQDQHTIARVWDACSDLTRHIQAKFVPDIRNEIFNRTWDGFLPTDFVTLSEAMGGEPVDQQAFTLDRILAATSSSSTADDAAIDDDDTGRYGAIIDFPNFLLHALKVHRRNGFSWETEGEGVDYVALDDKRLIEQFESLDAAEDVREFTLTLLRLRFLFDTYVIKTDRYGVNAEDDSNWVLQRAQQTPANLRLSPRNTFEEIDQREIVLQQSMFQVTDSRRSYKNFLFGILDFVHRATGGARTTLLSSEFRDELARLARSRYDLIRSTGFPFDLGTGVPHFVFNYLDYRLWHLSVRAESDAAAADLIDRRQAAGFDFRYRTSVEHFKPVHSEHESWGTDVDMFGNLCIMTRSENSRRSNLEPGAKIEQYDSNEQSLKFQLMKTAAQVNGSWTVDTARAHGALMLDLLDRQVDVVSRSGR